MADAVVGSFDRLDVTFDEGEGPSDPRDDGSREELEVVLGRTGAARHFACFASASERRDLRRDARFDGSTFFEAALSRSV
jgi:hypothetical protein